MGWIPLAFADPDGKPRLRACCIPRLLRILAAVRY